MTRRVPDPTDRLCFREYTADDLNFVAELFSDDQAREFYPKIDSEKEHRSWVEWNLANYSDHGFGLWVIERIDDGSQLGDCGLTVQDVAGNEMLEIGYHLIERYRGRGYATEAAVACRDYGFDVVGADTLCSIVDPKNMVSVSVASRLHDQRTSFINKNGDEMFLFTTERPHQRR